MGVGVGIIMLPSLYILYYPFCDSDLRVTHAHTLLPAALASVSFGFVLVRVRGRAACCVAIPVSRFHGISARGG
jgi:hypothetical protein